MKIGRKVTAFIIFSVLTGSWAVFAQSKISASNGVSEITGETDISKFVSETSVGARSLTPTPQLAMSSGDYPVTAGDVYTLAFAAGTSPVTYTVSVDSTYKFRVANLAVLNVSGMTFLQLKKQVEDIVSKNYPLSGVQFVLMSPSVFQVTINGEVNQTQIKEAWALSRLSSVVKGCTTDYSSVRDIEVTSANGRKRTYDLFKAERMGDLSQDPYVRPGDIITLSRIKRKVTVSGAVERPGTYELMKGENLKELIEVYGNGLTDLADPSRISLSRFMEGEKGDSGKTIYLDEKNIAENFVLFNHDSINVAGLTSEKHYITVEGIIGLPMTENNGVYSDADLNPNTLQKMAVTFLPGTNYANFVRAHKDMFNNYSDLANVYVERGDELLGIDAEKIIYNETFVSDYFVEDGDIMHVPFQQSYNTIFVTGEVVQSFERSAWPMVRLSSVLRTDALDASEANSPVLTDYASVRNVEVTAVDGTKKVYDLFKAKRFGDMSENPYIKAGETVTVKRVDRKVTVSGAVERPGVYELLEGENLKDLVEYYGGGLTDFADTDRIELVRYLVNRNVIHTLYLKGENISENFNLEDHDRVYVSSITDFKPVMFIEGALRSAEKGSSVSAAEMDKVSVRYDDGTNYAYLIRNNAGAFASNADLENAYIVRGNEIIPIDINKILFDRSYFSEEVVQPYDTLRIPFKLYYVTVSGAVHAPGRYPYIPDRGWEYYIALAGGFEKSRNSKDAIKITDSQGNKMKKGDAILPETTIEAKSNRMSYVLNSNVTPWISIVTTFISTVALILNFVK